jgi:hypothetical protein
VAARDSGNHPYFFDTVEWRVETLRPPRVFAVDVDVDERAELAALVEEEIGDRQRPQRVSDRRRLELEPALPARLFGEQGRQSN